MSYYGVCLKLTVNDYRVYVLQIIVLRTLEGLIWNNWSGHCGIGLDTCTWHEMKWFSDPRVVRIVRFTHYEMFSKLITIIIIKYVLSPNTMYIKILDQWIIK